MLDSGKLRMAAQTKRASWQYFHRVVLYVFGFNALIGILLLASNPRRAPAFLAVAGLCFVISPIKRYLVLSLLSFIAIRGIVGVVLYRQPIGLAFAAAAGILLIAVVKYWAASPAEDEFEIPDDALRILPDIITVLALFGLYAAFR